MLVLGIRLSKSPLRLYLTDTDVCRAIYGFMNVGLGALGQKLVAGRVTRGSVSLMALARRISDVRQ